MDYSPRHTRVEYGGLFFPFILSYTFLSAAAAAAFYYWSVVASAVKGIFLEFVVPDDVHSEKRNREGFGNRKQSPPGYNLGGVAVLLAYELERLNTLDGDDYDDLVLLGGCNGVVMFKFSANPINILSLASFSITTRSKY